MTRHRSGKTPRSPAAAAPPAPDAEPAAAPASEVPPDTAAQDGDGGRGGDDLGEAAASPADQEDAGDDGRAEDAGGDMPRATQTMRRFRRPREEGDPKRKTPSDEEATASCGSAWTGAQAQGRVSGTAAPPRRSSAPAGTGGRVGLARKRKRSTVRRRRG